MATGNSMSTTGPKKAAKPKKCKITFGGTGKAKRSRSGKELGWLKRAEGFSGALSLRCFFGCLLGGDGYPVSPKRVFFWIRYSLIGSSWYKIISNREKLDVKRGLVEQTYSGSIYKAHIQEVFETYMYKTAFKIETTKAKAQQNAYCPGGGIQKSVDLPN